MHITPPQAGQSLSDFVVSLLRTVVPVVWGALITWLVGLVPALTDFVDPTTLTNWGVPVTAFVAAVWYALMRKLEPHLPAWLTVIVLGSNATPTYITNTFAQRVSDAVGTATQEGIRRSDLTGRGVLTKLDADGNPTGEQLPIAGPITMNLTPPDDDAGSNVPEQRG